MCKPRHLLLLTTTLFSLTNLASEQPQHPFDCFHTQGQVKLKIERAENSGLLMLKTSSNSTISVTMQGGVAFYSFGEKQLPIIALDDKDSNIWEIELDCTISMRSKVANK